MASENASRMSASTMEDGPLVSAARATEAGARVGIERLKGAVDGSRDYVKENPMRSVLVAVGVGALLGYLIGRRR